METAIANTWGIVLAGGEGNRLSRLTRYIAGDQCPKQFCRVTGGRTLLGQTLARIAPLIAQERTVVVGNRAHAGYLCRDLPGPVPRALLQPSNKGTGPGILWPVHWVSWRDPEAVVAVFPSDHFILQDRALLAHVARATRVVELRPEAVVILGMEADGPEEEYGWIEPGEPVPEAPGCSGVRGFWEKPSAERARAFLRSGFLWNSLIVVARVEALKALGRRYMPSVDSRLSRLAAFARTEDQAWALHQAYALMRSANFSQEALTPCDSSLVVLPVCGVLWSDWGTPDRVVRTLRRIGASPPWLDSWSRQPADKKSGAEHAFCHVRQFVSPRK